MKGKSADANTQLSQVLALSGSSHLKKKCLNKQLEILLKHILKIENRRQEIEAARVGKITEGLRRLLCKREGWMAISRMCVMVL